MGPSQTSARHRGLRLVDGPAKATGLTVAAPPSADDSELLSALRSGDRSVATAFHDRVRPQVDRTIRRLLGANDPDRDDVAQVALMEIVTSIDRFRGDCSLDAWVSKLTAHTVFKKIRRRRLERRMFEQAELDDSHGDTQSDSNARGSLRGHLDRVAGHLNEMDPGRAWAFLLHDVWGYDLRETAQIMEISVGAAQSRLVRGRREVHSRVAEDPELAAALDDIEGAS